MITLITANWLLYVIALLIGIVTAFWAWAASGGEASNVESFNPEDGLLKKAGEPVRSAEIPAEPTAPEVVVAAPAAAEPAPAKPVVRPAKVATTPAAITPKPIAEPVVEVAAAPAAADKTDASAPNIPAAVGDPDNLRLIKGVGPKLNTLLNNLGISRFDQIAAWKEAQIIEVDQYLENFAGRITRDAWIDQAKYLAKDDIAGFEKKYGKL
jgi:predicted flap endonuclease-1-like 5' DNA nuclease